MFKLLAVRENMFAIQDTEDGKIDVCIAPEIMRFLHLGIEIGGITPNFEQNTFTYTDEYFLPDVDDDNDEYDEDEYEEYSGYEEEYEEEYEDSDEDEAYEDSSEVDISEEDEEYEEYEEEDYGEAEEPEFDDYDEYDDDDYSMYEQETTAVNKLYAILTDEQKDALKRFYLWASQIMFQDAPTQGTFKVSTRNYQNKKIRLNQLKGQGSNWVYAGFIDLEFLGAGHCTFGHALRYEHFAWDISYAKMEDDFWGVDHSCINWDRLNALIDSGHVIKFGIECVGDFFDVPRETLMKIKTMQAQSIAEMEQLYNIYSDANRFANAKASFSVFEALADSLVAEEARNKIMKGKDYVPSEDSNLFTFYSEFKRLGIIYPRMLVKRMQNVLLHRETHKYKIARPLTNDVIVENLKRLRSVDTSMLQSLIKESRLGRYTMNLYRPYLENFFFLQTGGIYAYNPYSSNPRDRDEGMKNSESRGYFNSITGTTDADEKDIQSVMEDYYMYPMCFNQFRSYDFQMIGCQWDISFTVEEVGQLNEIYVLSDALRDLKQDAHLDAVMLDRTRASEDNILSYRNVSKDYWDRLWREYSPDDMLTSIYSFHSSDNISTFADVISFLRNKRDSATATVLLLKTKLSEMDTELISDLKKRGIFDKCWDIRTLTPDEAQIAVLKGRKSYELEQQMKADSASGAVEKPVLATSDTDSTNEGKKVLTGNPVTPSQIWEYCIKEVGEHGVLNANISESRMIAAVQYAIDNIPQSVNRLNAVNPIIVKIMNTLQVQGSPSEKQMFWVRKGFQKLMKPYDPHSVVPQRNTAPQQSVPIGSNQGLVNTVNTPPVDSVVKQDVQSTSSQGSTVSTSNTPVFTISGKTIVSSKRMKLSEHPDIARDVQAVMARVGDLGDAGFESQADIIKVTNALRATRSGLITEGQYNCILDAKHRLGID